MTDSTMTPEERIQAAFEVLRQAVQGDEALVRQALTRAYPEDFPPKPKWPDSFAEKLYKDFRYERRAAPAAYNDGVDAALEAVAPIIKAAVEVNRRLDFTAREALKKAIDEAGL